MNGKSIHFHSFHKFSVEKTSCHAYLSLESNYYFFTLLVSITLYKKLFAYIEIK
jgi:hypothetical protein